MKDLNQLDEDLAQSAQVVLLYFSTPDCGVCHAVRPKVEELLKERPQISAYAIDLSILPAASGRFEVFVAPTVLVFINGRETIREARYFSMDTLSDKIDRYLSLLESA
ncbi:thioredoxin family protein [Salinispira pacifica]